MIRASWTGIHFGVDFADSSGSYAVIWYRNQIFNSISELAAFISHSKYRRRYERRKR